jgi:hypothetical protein
MKMSYKLVQHFCVALPCRQTILFYILDTCKKLETVELMFIPQRTQAWAVATYNYIYTYSSYRLATD